MIHIILISKDHTNFEFGATLMTGGQQYW